MEAVNQSQLKNALKISDWSQLSGYSMLKYIKMLPAMEKKLHLNVLEQAPNLLKEVDNVTGVIKGVINENEKLSEETKQEYNKIINALSEMLRKDNLTKEEHEKIFEELVKISSFLNTADKRSENLEITITNDIFKTAIVGIVLAGLIWGGKSILTSII